LQTDGTAVLLLALSAVVSERTTVDKLNGVNQFS